MNQVLELFGDIESFLRRDKDFSSATHTKLLSFFNDTQTRVMLKVELAIVVDFGVHFVKTTYLLEGDSPLVFQCYKAIMSLTTTVNLFHYPNLSAVARELSNNNLALQQQLETYAKLSHVYSLLFSITASRY